MRIDACQREGAIELIPFFKLTIENSEEFENIFNQKALIQGERIIAMNFENVGFIDSSGMGSLIKILNSCKEKQKELIIHSVSQKVNQIFKLARLERYFNIMESRDFSFAYPIE